MTYPVGPVSGRLQTGGTLRGRLSFQGGLSGGLSIGTTSSYPANTSDLTNDGADGVHPFLSTTSKTRTGKVLYIDDACPGIAPLSLPAGAVVYGANMYQINAETRKSGNVDFTVSATDPNTVMVDGTSTANGYSYGSISKSNAKMLLQPGAYFFKMFTTNDSINFYINVLSDESSTTLSEAVGKAADYLYTLVLTERSYVAVRVQVPSGVACNKDIVSIYASKVPSDGTYSTYAAPDGLMREKTVVMCQSSTDAVTYCACMPENFLPFEIDVATFNCGDYSSGSISYTNIPTGNLNEYANYIASLDADILFTQEDRLYWNISGQVTTRSILYDYLYAYGGVWSRSTSGGGVGAKGIYSNYKLINKGRYTFTTQGTTTDGGSTYFWNSFTYYFLRFSGGKEVLLISVHLAPKDWNTTARKAQIAEILAFVNACGNEYVIIAGDMNTWSDEMDSFSGYVLANEGLFGDLDTYYGSNVHPFDNIIVTPNIKIRSVRVHTDNTFQDHYALSAKLSLNY